MKAPLALIVICLAGSAVMYFNVVDNDNDNSSVPRWFSVSLKPDCNDENPEIHPGAIDIPNNQIDEDCDGTDFVQPDFAIDKDKDGFSEVQGDCNDDDSSVNPDAEEKTGDELDSNCDGDINPKSQELVLMQNVISPNFSNFNPTSAKDFVEKIGGSVISLKNPLKEAKIHIEAQADASFDKHVAVAIYLQTDISDRLTERNYTEYNKYIDSWYIAEEENGECRKIIDNNSPGVFFAPDVKVFDYDLRALPLTGSNCTNIKTIDVIDLLNDAARYGKDVKIGFYTSNAGIGKIVKASLIYTGGPVEVIE